MFKVEITSLKKLNSSKEYPKWRVIIATNQNTISIPHLIVNEEDKKSTKLVSLDVNLNLNGFRDTNIFSDKRILIFVYTFIEDTNGALQISDCFRKPYLAIMGKETTNFNTEYLKISITVQKQNIIVLKEKQMKTIKELENSFNMMSSKKFATYSMFKSNITKTFTSLSQFEINQVLNYEQIHGMNSIKNENELLIAIGGQNNISTSANPYIETISTKNLFSNTSRFLDILNSYRVKMNMEIMNLFNSTVYHNIFFDMNVFHEIPIISSLLYVGERSDESFWLNMLNATKDVLKGYNLKYDPKEAWVLMISLINTIGHTYVLEREDIYMESWISRLFDCDETMMIYRLYVLFTMKEFTILPELEELRKYALLYIPFTSFWYVKSPSASDVNTFEKVFTSSKNFYDPRAPKDPIGHFACTFILESFFYNHWKNRPKNIVISSSKDVLNPILFGESTSLLYPTTSQKKNFNEGNLIKEERTMRFLDTTDFYTHLNGLNTTRFLKSHNIMGFYAAVESGIPPKGVNYRIQFHQLRDNSFLEKISFYSMPKLSDEFINIARICSDDRMYMPDLFLNKKGIITNENFEKKINEIMEFVKKTCKLLLLQEEKEKKKTMFKIFSLDDLMTESVRFRFKQDFLNKSVSVKQYELMSGTFTFLFTFY